MELDDLSVQLRAQSQQIEEAIKRIDRLSLQAAQSAKSMENQVKMTDSLFGKLGGTVKTVIGFFGIQALWNWGKKLAESAFSAQQEMDKVRQTVENAGFAWEDVGDKIDAYAQKMVELGFDDEETSMSVAHLLEVTGDLTQAMAVNQVAVDLARRKGMSLTDATNVLSRAMTGSARILRDFGIVVKDDASAGEILNTVWSKVKGTAQASINPTEVFNVKMQNLQETLGEKLIPSITDFFDAINNFVQSGGGDLLADILDKIGQAASGLANVMDGVMNGKWGKMKFGWEYSKKIGEFDTKINMKEQAIKQSEFQEKYLSWIPWLGGKKGIRNNRARLYQELSDLNNEKLKYIEESEKDFDKKFGKSGSNTGLTCAVCGKKFKSKAEFDAHRQGELNGVNTGGGSKNQKTTTDVNDVLNQRLARNRHELELQGEAFDKTSADAEAYKNAILDMYEVDPKNIKIAEWTAEFKKLSDQIEKGKNAKEVTEILDELQKSLKSADEQATIFGDQEASLSGKADALKTAITELLSKGIDPTNTKMGNLVQQYKEAQSAVDKYNKAVENQKNAESLLNEGNQRLAEMTGPAIPEWESFAKSLEDAAKADGVLAETSKKLNEIAKSIREAGQAAADSELADRLREIGLEAAQTEIDQQIASLENQRDLISLGTDEVAIRNQSLEIERQIVALQKQKIDLDIADLEAKRDAALKAKDEAEAKRLEIEIMKLRNDKTNLNTELYIDEQRPMAEFTKEFQGEFSNAVQEALEGGGKKGFEGLLDYIKKKGTQKIADLITNWIFGNQQGQGFLGNLASAFGVQGAGNQNGGSNMVNLGNGQGVQRMNMPAEGSPMTNNMQMGAGSGFGQNAMGAMAGMAMGSQGGKVGVGATVGSMIGMIWGPIGSMVGGLLGGMIDGLFGDNGSQSMTIKANAASINADFATANFKQVTLPASYFGRSPSNNATSPVTTISVINNIRGSVITEKDLQKTITETAGQVVAKAQSDSNKWQPMVIQGG